MSHPKDFFKYLTRSIRLVQAAEHMTLDLRIVSLSPMLQVEITEE